jgi:hypothetical protein
MRRADRCCADNEQDLIAGLLIRDPAKRLGARAGAEDIKAQPFFSCIDWALLRNRKPPFVPNRAAGGERLVASDGFQDF